MIVLLLLMLLFVFPFICYVFCYSPPAKRIGDKLLPDLMIDRMGISRIVEE